MILLGIESSCDETAAACVTDGREVLSNRVYSQIARHRPYGGVVPEIASRAHIEALPEVLRGAVEEEGPGWERIDAVAVTYGPGLAGALLAGLSAARGLSLRLERPLFAVNHLEAHLYSLFLDPRAPSPDTLGPVLILLVSGGHTALVRMTPGPGRPRFRLLGQTLDDAAGEALDKGANLLGLGYPGGPAIEETARKGDAAAIRFPRHAGFRDARHTAGLDPACCFSFSGVKTALLYYLRDHPEAASERLADVCASYQEAVFDPLVQRSEQALRGARVSAFACVGGVAGNRRLRAKLEALAERAGTRLLLAPPQYCTDNAAMIALLAAAGGGEKVDPRRGPDARPNLSLPRAG